VVFSYAAGEVGNKKAEKAARELAYTKRDSSSYIKPAGWVLANDSIDINRIKESTPPVSASPDPSKTFSVKDWKKIQNNYNSNKTAKFGNVSQNTTVYYGELNLGNKGEDLKYSDYTDDELTKILGITKMDLKYSERTHLFIFKDLASKTSVGDMEDVILDMIDHFADGTGTDYQNEVLTKAVEKHSETQRYMNDFTDVFKTQFELNNGDIESVADSNNIHDALRNQGVLLSKYDYFGIGDIFGGLTMAVHSWTESEVKVTDININDDGTYNGVLEFTFKDNFGLDKDDVEKYWVIPGFKNWFILQHSNQYKEKYKPFKTVVRIYKKFDGKIEGYKQ